jgi:hypothetical protein
MKQPHVKNDFRASNEAVEIRWFVQVAPPSDDSPWNVEIRWFEGSSRVSCQIANHMPLASTPIAGKNWSRGAAAPFGFTLIGFGAVQVAPQSFDVWSEMSAPEIVRFALFW